MQVPGAGPFGREGLPPPGFVGFGTEPEPLPNGSEASPEPVPAPPLAEFESLPLLGPSPPGLPEAGRFPASAIAFLELPPPPGLVAVTGEPVWGDRGARPEPAPNGSEEGRSPSGLAPPEEFEARAPGAAPPGLSEAEGFGTPAIAFLELPLPPGLVAVTGAGATGDRGEGPEPAANGSTAGSPLPAELDREGGLFCSGLAAEAGFPAFAAKSGELLAPLGRDAVTGGSPSGGGNFAVVLGLSICGESGNGSLDSLAIGLLGVSGELKSRSGAIGLGC